MKIKPVILFISLVAMTAVLSACSSKVETSEEPTPAAVTETQAPSIEETTQPSGPAIYSDKSEEISVSDDAKELTITLEGNATTGYEWSFSLYGDKVLKEVSTEYIVNDHAEGMVGVGGRWVSKYKVTGDGKATILADYQRSWEDAPIESKQITVTVSEGKIISVENMQLEIDPVEETFIEETTASETVEETQEAETTAPAKTPETQPQSETEPVTVAPAIPEETVFVPENGNDMGCIDDGLTW